MAKGRKPAIELSGRPQGILDDIVRPIIQKGARAVAGVSKNPSVIVKAAKVSAEAGYKRGTAYNKQAKKLASKAAKANSMEKFRKSERLASRSLVASNKSDAAYKMGNVGKTAKQARLGYRQGKNAEAKYNARAATVAAKRRAGLR